MKITIKQRTTLSHLPSASGVEVVDGVIYVVGDDSPYLYILNPDLSMMHQYELFQTQDFETGRIGKLVKPDFECMTAARVSGKMYMVILGSGSRSPQRDVAYLVEILERPQPDRELKLKSQRVDLTRLYDALRSTPEMKAQNKMNLEAAAASADKMILFQRGNVSGHNLAIYYDLNEFIAHLQDTSRPVPQPEILTYDPPRLSGIAGGFSGAGVLPDGRNILYTASVENTTSELEDGETLGSFIGVMPLESHDPTPSNVEPLRENGKIYVGKVESVAVLDSPAPDKYTAIAVTDDDQGGSEVLLLEIDVSA